jgi:hypothetical protein
MQLSVPGSWPRRVLPQTPKKQLGQNMTTCNVGITYDIGNHKSMDALILHSRLGRATPISGRTSYNGLIPPIALLPLIFPDDGAKVTIRERTYSNGVFCPLDRCCDASAAKVLKSSPRRPPHGHESRSSYRQFYRIFIPEENTTRSYCC